MLGTTLSKVNAIDQMISIVRSPNSNFTASVRSLKSEFRTIEGYSKSNITKYMRAQLACISSKSESACEEFESLKGSAVESMISQSQAFSSYQFANLFDQSKDDYVQELEKERGKYQDRANKITALMGDAGPYLGSLLDDSALSVENITDANRDDSWFQFEFDSQSYMENKPFSAQSESVTNQWPAKVSVTVKGNTKTVTSIKAGSSVVSSRRKYHFERSMSNSTVRVRGELLRVTIKRPWFKPEVFDNPEFTFVSRVHSGCMHNNYLYLL